MPKLIIDDIPVEVAPGTSVLEAARSVGITIPHFCYHPALAIAAACRLCAVKLLDGPVKGIQMSCALPAQDGMVVSTTDPEALKMRSLVIEWLMLNHPHDCPVCDEGGECLLQDFTIAGGHSHRRYQGKKRTFQNQYLGEGIQHEMNRCIECYRCARFYQDYAGGTDFGVMGSAGRVYFGRFQEGPLESPFSGNLVDICPTGVFTDKTGRFRARYWDYQFAPSICQHCSVGCNTSPQNFQRETIKIVGRRNDQVNGWFICDRARFDKGYLNDPQRPREPRLDGATCGDDVAVDAAAKSIAEFVRKNGADSLALVGSPRLSLEGMVLLAQLARAAGGARLCYFGDPAQQQGSVAAARLLREENSAYVRDIEQAQWIALHALDLIEEAPMLALSVRKAFLAGAQIFLVDGDPIPARNTPPFKYTAVESLDQVPFEKGGKGVIICGAGKKDPDLLAQIASCGAKLVMLQPGANGFAAGLLAQEHAASPLADLVAARQVRGVVCFEADVPEGLLSGLEVLASADWRRGPVEAKSPIFIPTTTWVESDGTAINYEGRAQRFQRSRLAGLPLKGLDPKYYGNATEAVTLHPPRVHREEVPGGAERDAWQVMAQLIARLGGEPVVEPLEGKWSALRSLDPEGEGIRIFEIVAGE
ncbi:(2Fe-2S)-binding protein [Geomonas sp. Red69]|uniref:(2Fe-2S)-binding protein n=1 Tax=Geomonas diazotrophica TaxID=2843197 RepID=A0ABX8JIH6_9BACT|nr:MULTISPECIES: 2Fe-2S iron-sulfur cluster-binding protein [Geomonas]MBU5635402.1 (2Fe-2S)-binding protein [Geomonas diazotrophica]QWV97543.1 (2Fe-2S)-binding protein [Geomonas nitrogeniifigens]QXE86683.1 (2Fe-2S)-binding protein [Geomonas nitrogeniifigens]